MLLPARMKPTARSKSAWALGVISTGVAGAPVAAERDCPAGAGAVEVEVAVFVATGAGGVCVGLLGAEPQAANPMAAIAAMRTPMAAPYRLEALSVEARDHILRQLRLAVTSGLELGQRLEALTHPLVVHTIFRPDRVQLVRLDSLLLERKHLLLQQRVVFLELL